MKRIPSIREQFALMRQLSRDFWGVQIVNFLDNTYGFAISVALTIMLSREFGFSDEMTGAVITTLGIFAFLFHFVAGPMVDKFGIRKSLFTSLGIVTVIRCSLVWVAFTPSLPYRQWIFIGLLFAHSLPATIKSTSYHIGNKLYTTEDVRKIAFDIWYLIMNIGAVAAGLILTLIDTRLHLGMHWVLTVGLISSALSFLSVKIIIRREGRVPQHASMWTWDYLKQVVWNSSFARMFAVITLTLGVRMVFSYWSILSPKYWKRTIGENAEIGLLSIINPILIIGGLMFSIWLAIRVSKGKEQEAPKIEEEIEAEKVRLHGRTYDQMTIGSFVAALALIPICLPWYWFSDDIATGYYTTNIISMVIFSIGELMFSPRLSQYIQDVAPDGQVGIYGSFASIPMFISGTFVGYMSGVMLVKWSPEYVETFTQTVPWQEMLKLHLPYSVTPEFMWMLLFTFAILGPLLMLPLRRWFKAGVRKDETTADVA